jgi:membrane fusion protein, heavy metal efflux system
MGRAKTIVKAARVLALSLMAIAHAGDRADTNRVALNEQQLKAGGVQFSALQKIAVGTATASAAALRLAGRVVVPNSARDVVLAPVTGRVEALLVDPGQAVVAGQMLVRIRSAEIVSLQRELVAARVRHGLAQTRVTRDMKLHDEGIIARNRLQESQAAATEAAAGLREQEQLLRLAGFTSGAIAQLRSARDIAPIVTLAAPRAGRVLQQTIQVGDAVASGDPLLHIAILDRLWVELQATREQAGRVAVGDSVTIRDCAQAGKVIATALQLDPQSQTVLVRAEMLRATDCLAPNQFVDAQLASQPTDTTLLAAPGAAVVQHRGRTYVFLREAAGLRPVPVLVERRAGGQVWLSGALPVGSEVASAGLAAVKGAWLGIGAPGQAN